MSRQNLNDKETHAIKQFLLLYKQTYIFSMHPPSLHRKKLNEQRAIFKVKGLFQPSAPLG